MRLKDGNLCGLQVLLVARDDVVDALAHGGEILHGILEVVELGTDAVINGIGIDGCRRCNLGEFGKLADDVHLLVVTRKDKTGGGVGHGRDADAENSAVGKAHYLQRRTAELLSPPDDVYHDDGVEEYCFYPYFCIRYSCLAFSYSKSSGSGLMP